ncbi:dTDP-glucose 4,6-dehydratase [Lunatimonas lonarensis]|uniref:dTDP-glucose 4,6-dehydratase n=1 Tax=Lunatimonas lonarensis TaxID=1232681 RepID=R7ZPC7_9BACT|nr:NAD-dependent epimerase [Lunatimonas lonarensis]EON75879.1 dTDP-glucose 4,6-dehydratase [Lunatimonas lonarensis]
MTKILVTGAAGFIGFHLCRQLLEMGHEVLGLDNINDYYDVNLKYDRLAELGIIADDHLPYNRIVTGEKYGGRFQFIKLNLEDRKALSELFQTHTFDKVCNLAAQAGVRYSLENPMAYIDSNITGFANLLECVRHAGIKKLVYASSSSVYGLNEKVPFSTDDRVDNPISLYAATKKSNELMAHTYSHLYDIQTIGLRFFTVYGPWGRPDMAMYLFTDAILNNRPIKVFNDGNLSRDFTYIDDIVNGIVATLVMEPPQTYSLYNIGNGNPVKLLDFIEAIETSLGIEAIKEMLPMQPGDVERTWADTEGLERNFNYKPSIPVEEGIMQFINWFRSYYNR